MIEDNNKQEGEEIYIDVDHLENSDILKSVAEGYNELKKQSLIEDLDFFLERLSLALAFIGKDDRRMIEFHNFLIKYSKVKSDFNILAEMKLEENGIE